MSTIVMPSDNTTLTLNGTLLTSLAEGDFITITPVNPATSHVNSGNGGVNINKRVDADVHDLVVRVQRNSEDDSFLNGVERQETPEVLNGSCKTNFNRDGVDGVESWTLQNGSITTKPTLTNNNTDGNAIVEYTIRFRSAKRNV